MGSAQAIAGAWVNDQLDLYNLAVSLGDMAWQQDILGRLYNREKLIRQETELRTKEELWLRFDEINGRMLVLYRELRSISHKGTEQALREEALELKKQRTRIGIRLRQLG
ncbi:MAG: hypothetical protein K0Q90_727 [Paenibacillaceae bacterium]|nr:hypothetical protein [Paenibacillaceae bacterium]